MKPPTSFTHTISHTSHPPTSQTPAMTTKSAQLNPGIITSPGIKDLFPLVLYNQSEPIPPRPIPFATFEDFTAFIGTLPGYYTVYIKDNSLTVDEYVLNQGSYAVFQSQPQRQL